MAKGNGEEISTGSLPLLSQGWDHKSLTTVGRCRASLYGFVGVKKVHGPAWGEKKAWVRIRD
jgi:hypothetical protein